MRYPKSVPSRRAIATLVVLVLGWIVLAPTLALATGKLALGNWGQLCTADGQLRLTADPAASLPKAPEQAAWAHLGEHCPFCQVEPAHPAPPLRPVPQPFKWLIRPLSTRLDADPDLDLALWPPAQPRAPPARSRAV